MSVSRGFGINGKSTYTNVTKPTEVWLSFVVSAANAAGLGTTSVKSNGYVEAVFMHTSMTPGVVNGLTNPNPALGYAQIVLKNNFNKFLGLFSSQVIATTSNSTTSLTTGSVYVITALGSTTTANWVTAGVPAGIAPAVGVSFVSAITASITGTGTVGLPDVPLATTMTVVGNSNTTLANSNLASQAGARIMLQFSAPTVSVGAYVQPIIPVNPADGSIVLMKLCFDGSSVSIDGL